MILLVVLFWCETCSPTLREERRLRVTEQGTGGGGIFTPKMEE